MRAFNKRKKKKPLFRLGKRLSFVSLERITWSVKIWIVIGIGVF